jgi:penicillin-binding protein 1A
MESGKYGKWTHLTYEQYQARTAGNEDPSKSESPYIQGAAVVIDPRTGAVRALIGGRDFDDSKFNRATQALRQPGSTFKPIVYATAVQNGRSPATSIEDVPISVPQVDGSLWTPQNYDMKFEGPMTMRRGLAQSRNLIAIRVGMELGEQAVIDEARRFGITTPIPPYPSIFIGSADVYPLELIASYGTFANLGSRVAPNAIVRVENQQGQVIWQPKPPRTQVLSPGEAWLMVNMMKDVVLRGTAAGSVWGAGFRVPSGGKTGTTNDGADVWYVGYTADLVAGIWMGFDKPKKIISNAQGGRLAAPAYTQLMMEVYRRKPAPPDWPRPDAVVTADACAADGSTYTEFFLAGTEEDNGCGVVVGDPFFIPPSGDTIAGAPSTAVRPAPGAPKAKTKAKADTANPFKIPDAR